MSYSLIIVLILLFLLVSYLLGASRYSKRLIHIGLTAAQSYAYYGDKASLYAYLTVFSRLSNFNKSRLINYTNVISSSVKDNDAFDSASLTKRVEEIISMASLIKTGVKEKMYYKELLSSISKEWLLAINKLDVELANDLFQKELSKSILQELKDKPQSNKTK